MGVADWIATVAAALALPYVTYIVARNTRKATSEQQQLERQDERITKLEEAIRLQGDYIFKLRDHIAEGKGPPPPPWPEGMTR